jgi:hypothetical protein
LTQVLADKHRYQAEVTTQLSEQVLDALWELLRGFQSANAAVNGTLLGALTKANPQHIYGGLVTTVMRLVFLLYAEDEGLMPKTEIYQQKYAVWGLYEKLRQDADISHNLEQRYGVWAALLSLFRLVYEGGETTGESFPARAGQLFSPDEYPFLEGRHPDDRLISNSRIKTPCISDEAVYHILDKLIVLNGERLSYRSLDVEQIGSVYELIMGYELQITTGRSIAVRPKDIIVNLDEILSAHPVDRIKLLKQAECVLKGAALKALKNAKSVEAIVEAIGCRVSPRTPHCLPAGSWVLQPGAARRRSGLHYTPRSLTQPIVEKTLEPLLMQLGEHPTPEQLLELKVCDLAMGSAAFLLEACRQLADRLVEAWSDYGKPANLSEAVEDVVAARRLVAQRCLYGVDKNPLAVDLARLSLWLMTLAKDLPFTFLDHALKCGDSLVGLTRSQICSFGRGLCSDLLPINLSPTDLSTNPPIRSQQTFAKARLTANIAIAAFFDGAGKSKHAAQEVSDRYQAALWQLQLEPLQQIQACLKDGDKGIQPFNWEIEFPEVFDRPNPGFDAIVGNPPFAGKNTITNAHRDGYLDWLKSIHPESHGNADLVAHFFRRAFTLTRKGGTFGLIATNTIAQGDTRSTGLRFICNHGGVIYNATRRHKWPGLAAVVVSVVHIIKETEGRD